MSAKAGIKKHGNKVIEALFKDFMQLENRDTFVEVDPKNLSLEQKRNALRVVSVVKEKRVNPIKGRTCANGMKQW